MRSVMCLNGPNLDQLGLRQPDVYGTTTLAELEQQLADWGRQRGVEINSFQSNHEGELIEAIHSARHTAGLVVNPGALTHTSHALADALASVSTPSVEVHLSNVRSRARWRRRSLIAPVVSATIYGRGVEGYRAAVRHLDHIAAGPVHTIRYGPHPDQHVDFRPGDASIGVVILHGGFWGDAWGKDTTASWATDLAARGIPSANVEFRRVGSGGGAVPTLGDVAAAVRLARERFQGRRIAVVGHSTGAQLAVAATVAHAVPVDHLVLVSGVLAYADAEGEADALRAFDPDSRYDPVALDVPPAAVTIVHGGRDDVVPTRSSHRYADHLARRDPVARVEIVDDERHFDVLSAGSESWRRVIAALS